MRTTVLAFLLAAAAPAALAQEGSIKTPTGAVANYDPTMSAKEAVLANWELAAAGIRAGRIVGSQVVDLAAGDASYAALVRQAQFAQKTMVQRFNAALWVYTDGTGVSGQPDGAALAQAVAAANTVCDRDDCTPERAALADAFARATAELGEAATTARVALTAREDQRDVALMAEQLTLMADYLDGGSWAEDFNLTAFGRDGEEVAARIVGTMSLWRNIEPYVGLTDPEIDRAINDASQQLLRTLRRVIREGGALDPDGPELAQIAAKAEILAAEFRRAAGLFSA